MSGAARKSDGGTGAALLLGLAIVYFWVGLTPFPNLGAPSLADPWAGNSNALNQMIAIVLAGVLAIHALRHPLAREIARPRLLLVAILFAFVLASMAADEPSTAIRRLVITTIVVFAAPVLLLLPRNATHFAKIIGITLGLLLALAYFGVVFMPRLAIHQASDVIEPALAGDWRGYFNHKNTAAPAMAFTVFAGMFVWARWSRFAGALLVVGAFVFLWQTGGKTSLALVPVVLAAAWIFERVRISRMLLALGGVALFNIVAVGSAVWAPVRQFVSGLGIDATFTDRVDIWKLAFDAIASRPLTGYGLSGFWQTESLVYGGSTLGTWAVTAANAHNAYLETAIAIGIPGTLLVVLWLVVLPARDADAAFAGDNDRALTRFYTRIWLYGLYASCVESFFFTSSGPVWITILLAVFGLRYQRRTQLVTRPVAVPSGAAYA